MIHCNLSENGILLIINVIIIICSGCTQLEHLNIGSCQIEAHSNALDEFLSNLQ